MLVVIAALGGLTACNSTPSARRVALDVIETLPQPEEVKQCMRDKVEGYSQETIEDFAKGSDQNPPAPDAVAAKQAFEDDLQSCVTSG